MPREFSEDTLIEQPAIEIFAGLGWQTIGAFEEAFGSGGTLGRESAGEVVLLRHLVPALKKLNPEAPLEAIDAAVTELTRDRAVMSQTAANREVYALLKNGVKVEIRNPDGQLMPERIKVIDWENPANNHFLLVSQMWVTGEMYRRRPDLVGFVNGLPLAVAEFKAVKERVEAAFKDNIRDYRQTIPHLFVYNGLILVSNGVEGKMGSVTAAWEHYCDWKKISSEAEPGSVSLETLVKGTCDKTRLLDLVENFTLFEERAGKIRQVVAKNHQYLGVNNAIDAVLGLKHNQGRLGVFWQISCGFYCLVAAGLFRGQSVAAAHETAVHIIGPLFQSKALTGERHHFAKALSADLAKLPEDEIASGGHVVDTLTASLWCLLTSRDYEETVLKAVNLGEDTDTTAIVAGGLAEVHYGLALVLEHWRVALARVNDLGRLFEEFVGVCSPK